MNTPEEVLALQTEWKRLLVFGWNAQGDAPESWTPDAPLTSREQVSAWLLGWERDTELPQLNMPGRYRIWANNRTVWVVQDLDWHRLLPATESAPEDIDRAVEVIEQNGVLHVVVTLAPSAVIECDEDMLRALRDSGARVRNVTVDGYTQAHAQWGAGTYDSVELNRLFDFTAQYHDNYEPTHQDYVDAITVFRRCETCGAAGQRFNHDLNGCSSGEDPHIQTVKTALRTMVHHPTNLQVDANPKAAKVISQWAELMERYPEAGLAWMIATIRHCDPVFLQKLGEMLARENDTPPLVN